ncbi:MAG: tetratricopeptide repeat protein [Pseudobdellovibrionaceae bacterium]
MRILTVLLAISIFQGCSLLPLRKSEVAIESQENRDFNLLEQQIQLQNFAAACQSAENFQNSYPYSLKLQRVRFLKAGALEELGRWTEAEDTYKTISTISEKNQPEISAKSIYRLSFVYEALGDDQRVIATLFEAAKYHRDLSPEVVNAEIPSRLAMIYAKVDNFKEAQKWLDEADKGLKKTLETRSEPLTKKWLAELYFNMGSISTQQVSNDNIVTLIQGQSAVQKYLIRALQYDDPVWSAKALKKIRATYMDLWKTIETFPEASGYEPLVAQKIKKDEQLRLAGPFSDLIKEAELYRPGVGQTSNPYQTEFFNFLEELQTRVVSVLGEPLFTPLMSGQEKTAKKPKTSVKILPSEDPNL